MCSLSFVPQSHVFSTTSLHLQKTTIMEMTCVPVDAGRSRYFAPFKGLLPPPLPLLKLLNNKAMLARTLVNR